MMYIHITFSKKNHSTELFKIFFSLLTLSTAFLQKACGSGKNSHIDLNQLIVFYRCLLIFFPGPLAFCKKAVERVSSEKNILNSSVECVEWSGVVFFIKSHMYAHHQIRLNELINMMYFIFNLNAYFSRN